MERQRRRQLRDLNVRAWAGDKDVLDVSNSLDSSLKKNTAFIKRLRTGISAAAVATFVQEIRTLSLHKYLSEIISACFEGLCKLKQPAEVAAGVEVFSTLHQRFGPEEFTLYIGWLIGRGLSTPDKAQLKTLSQDVREREEKERSARHRVLVRVATELWLVGALRSLEDVARPEVIAKTKENLKGSGGGSHGKTVLNGFKPTVAEAEPFPLEVLKDLLGHDSQHTNLPLLVSFLKAFAWDFLGVKSLDEELTPDDPPMVEPPLQERFKNIFTRYFTDAAAHLVREQKALGAQGRRNAEAYVRSGEIFEDRQTNHEKQLKSHEKFVTNTRILAETLGLEMPDLKEQDQSASAGDGTIGLVKAGDFLRGQGDGAGIWEDDDERRFYENLVDLKDRVPSVLLEDAKKKKSEDEPAGKKTEEKNATKPAEEPQEKPEDLAETSTSIANKNVGAQVDALLARLPELSTKEMADQVAIDFCFLNSKASRNRLIKALQDVPKGRSDLLPFYARLATTFGKYMTDVSHALISHLDEEFRSLQRRKQKDILGQVRTINIRYLAELTKFGLVPEHVIFHCLKVSLEDFSKMNIEIICNLLENCGRYLLRNPETSPRMNSFLETLQRKKAAQHLGPQERMLIENATYYVNPPERAAIQQKERTPVELFIRKLIYLDMTKRTVEKIAKQIRKLHWEEADVVNILHKVFVKPARIKYINIHFLAIILGAIKAYRQEFVISVVDDVLESITLGLEMNDFKFNQRRMAEVKYLGELYVFKVVDSSVIFDTLFKILSFGHEGGYPKPGSVCHLDSSDDFFRIRLVCNLLDTCGIYFEKGAAKKKMDFFLTFFQYYIYTKEPMPMDIEFVVQETLAILRPQWTLAKSLEEAGDRLSKASKDNAVSSAAEKQAEVEEIEDADDETPHDEVQLGDGEDGISSGEDLEGVAEEEQPVTPDDDDDEEEHIIVTRPEDERDPEADAEFDRELAKLMSESMETRKFERKPVFDVALPMRRAQRESATAGDDSGNESPTSAPTTTRFSLLSKKGNRPQLETRSIDLPSDSNFAIAMRTQREAEKAEQQRIKKLVLNYELGDGDDQNGDDNSLYILSPNLNRVSFAKTSDQGYLDPQQQKHHHTASGSTSSNQGQSSRAGGSRRQQARKLQLSDVDWYDRSSYITPDSPAFPSATDTVHASDREPQRGRRPRRNRRLFHTVG